MSVICSTYSGESVVICDIKKWLTTIERHYISLHYWFHFTGAMTIAGGTLCDWHFVWQFCETSSSKVCTTFCVQLEKHRCCHLYFCEWCRRPISVVIVTLQHPLSISFDVTDLTANLHFHCAEEAWLQTALSALYLTFHDEKVQP